MRPVLPAILSLLVALAGAGPAMAQDCSDCHERPSLEVFAGSGHGFLECADCHGGFDENAHPEGSLEVDCRICHEEAVDEYECGQHGHAHAEGILEAPACESCHGEIHEVIVHTEPGSPVHPSNLAGTCGRCHADPKMVAKFGIPVAQPMAAYEASVHAGVIAEGGDAATCSSCHGTHCMLPASDPESLVFHQRVPETCGNCHAEIAEDYRKSVHATGAAHGSREAPVCTDCHGEHRILSPADRDSPVFATNIPKMTCGRCHEDVRLADKYGIAPDKVPSYDDSYHGLASQAGAQTVAHCGSCHGVHDIRPSSDPESLIHQDNLAATCGHCHPGAGATFAIGAVHVLPTEKEHVAVYWARNVYLNLIWLTIGGMILHNLLDLRKKFFSRHEPSGAMPEPEERMYLGFRLAHVLLMTSFAALVYTGFALKYPDTWWARPILFWEDSFGLRGLLHRIAAVAMMIALGVHLVHLMVERRARRVIGAMRPTFDDVLEFRDRMLWYLGLRKDPPHVPALGYPEKLEYISLMWGIVVMAVTGFALWYENLALRWLPKWASDLATVIHFYEAILATLAIVVWHLYFVIFDPVVYPMDTAWVNGKAHPGRTLERRGPGGAEIVVHPGSDHEDPPVGRSATSA